MPRAAAIQVKPAEVKTRWTLSRNDPNPPLHTPDRKENEEVLVKMAANGFYYDNRDQSLPRYSSYDGSQYSEQSGRLSSQAAYRAPESVSNYDGFDFNMALDDRGSHHISVNTKITPRLQQRGQDAVASHLLYETALMDSQTFEILEIAEVDALKKEHVRLNSRIEAAQRKLTLESKVRDAAQNLQRLYSTNKRPDTPQSPESPKKSRHSLLPNRDRSGSRTSLNAETAGQADSELQASVRKVDELHEQITNLLDRRQYVERKLLRHTSAVLAEEANKNVESAVPGLANGRHGPLDDDDDVYTPNEFDGIRDILRGMPAGASNKVQQHEQQLASMQERLENLNSQLRSIISEADQTLGNKAAAEVPLDQSEDSTARLDNRFARLGDSVHTLQSNYTQLQDHMEHRLEGLNSTLHNAILTTSEAQPVPGLQRPPQLAGQGYQRQIEYMEESLMTMEQLIQQQTQSNSAGAARKLEEYDNVITGLWDILQSDVAASPKPAFQEDEDDLPPTPRTPFIESFSLQAFNSRVQNIFDRAQAAKDQQDILRTQIQQQRELNGKSDAKKDAQIASLQSEHDTLAAEHGQVQQELANYIVKHESTESEASQSRNELMNVMSELEEMKKTMDAKQAEREEAQKQMREQIESTQKQLANQRADSENFESEVVRLTTELTMAKAELDGAYGTRAERKGAQAGHVAQLEAELREMTNEFQELTKESIELEKEREQLDSLIDGLRDRCDSLEAQLSDERLRWVGAKSPGAVGGGINGGPFGAASEAKESMSMMVLRQEFKKMMREQRAEGLKHLRVSSILKAGAW